MAAGSRCNACLDLAKLDANIAQACQNLLDMRAQRVRLSSNVNDAHDFPSKHFNAEIFSNIFRQCLPDVDTLSKSDNGELTNVPLRLSQVCRHWRKISHSTPSLWNVMALYAKESQEFSFQSICEVARGWLARSGDKLPLYVVLKVEPEADSGGRNCLSIFKAIAEHEQRLDYLHIEASNTVIRRLQALAGDPSTLNISRTRHDTEFIVDPNIEDSDTKNSMLCTKSFHPKILRMNDTVLKNIAVSVNNLIHVDATGICLDDALHILCKSRNLISVKIKDIDMSPYEPDGYQEMLPSYLDQAFIQTFHVDSDTPNITGVLFSVFRAPSLKSLTLEDPSGSDWGELLTELANHLRESGTRLESLSFYNISFENSKDYQHFVDVLKLTRSSLNHIHVEAADEDGDAILASKIGPMLCQLPSLRSLKLCTNLLRWLHMLRSISAASSTLTPPNGEPLSITLWTNDSLLERKMGNIRPVSLSHHNKKYRPLGASDIQKILGLLDHKLISVAIIHCSLTHSSVTVEINITEKVVIGLRRVLRQMDEVESD